MPGAEYRQRVIWVMFWVLVFLSCHSVLMARVGLSNRTLPPEPLPLEVSDVEIKPLRSLVDPILQKKLEQKLSENPYWAKLIANRRMAVGLVDMSDPENVKFARVNGNHMMYAASLPKLAILLAAQQALEEGRISETPEVRADLRSMISQSSNEAATRMYNLVGGARYIEKVLRNPKYELYDTKYGGGLWVGRPYAKKGTRIGDPMKNLSHAATAMQVCRYYYLMAMGKLVNHYRSKQMLNYLVDPELHHKFVNSMDRVAPEAKLYRKSGTWRNWHADSMLCWGPSWRRYILVGLVEDPKGEQILRELVPVIEEVLGGYAEN